MTSILIVEDDRAISRLLQDYLRSSGFSTMTADDGDMAVSAVRSSQPDLMLLDLGLPGKDGLNVIRDVRRFSAVPIVIVTARGDEADRVVGLELGSDDYIVKPFSPREVAARIRAVLRRSNGSSELDTTLQAGDLELDRARMRVTVSQKPVDLTATEFQILSTMAARPGRVFTRSQLLDAVRGIAFEGYERAIDAHIKNIRRKIERDSGGPRYIQTVYGVGYRFAEDHST